MSNKACPCPAWSRGATHLGGTRAKPVWCCVACSEVRRANGFAWTRDRQEASRTRQEAGPNASDILLGAVRHLLGDALSMRPTPTYACACGAVTPWAGVHHFDKKDAPVCNPCAGAGKIAASVAA